MGKILNTPIKEEIFSLEFRIKKLANRKARYVEDYQAEIFKMGSFMLIPHIHKIINLVVKHDLPKPWIEIIIVHIFKVWIKVFPLTIGPL